MARPGLHRSRLAIRDDGTEEIQPVIGGGEEIHSDREDNGVADIPFGNTMLCGIAKDGRAGSRESYCCGFSGRSRRFGISGVPVGYPTAWSDGCPSGCQTDSRPK